MLPELEELPSSRSAEEELLLEELPEEAETSSEGSSSVSLDAPEELDEPDEEEEPEELELPELLEEPDEEPPMPPSKETVRVLLTTRLSL